MKPTPEQLSEIVEAAEAQQKGFVRGNAELQCTIKGRHAELGWRTDFGTHHPCLWYVSSADGGYLHRDGEWHADCGEDNLYANKSDAMELVAKYADAARVLELESRDQRLKDYQQRLASNPGLVTAAEVAAVIGRIMEGE